MLGCARLRYMVSTRRGNKKYMDMKNLDAAVEDALVVG